MSKSRAGNEIFEGQSTQQGGPLRSDVMKDEFGLDIPTETVPLPSRGMTYPEDHPLHGCETVDIRPMTAREEDILTSRALIKKGTVISHLLQACILTPGVDAATLLSGDRNFLLHNYNQQ